jgi:DNA polymerase-3 subunit epsilon
MSGFWSASTTAHRSCAASSDFGGDRGSFRPTIPSKIRSAGAVGEHLFVYGAGVVTARGDLATPLWEVEFVVLDLETTGASPATCAITEVGALRFRGGECVGTFATLVNPGVALPPAIVYLTGITEAMVAPAPVIDSVLPAFVEFIGDAVIVGHNVAFDLRFLGADLTRLGYPPLTNLIVDTCTLGRRLLRDEVDDCRLATLARHLGTEAEPCHRALDDARATAEVLHHVLERVGTIGVTGLDDLLALPRTAGHPQAAKLRWVAGLPRLPGVYLFRGAGDEVLFVGRARDVRARVRDLFAGRDGRRVGPLLREAQRLDHVVCADGDEAADLEHELLRRHRPRYNPQVRAWAEQRYVQLSAPRRRTTRAVVRKVPTGTATAIGPFGSPAAARQAADAVTALVEVLVGWRTATLAGEPEETVRARANALARAQRRATTPTPSERRSVA